MLGISPQFCSSGWVWDHLEDPINHIIEQENVNYFCRDQLTETSDSINDNLHNYSPNYSSMIHVKHTESASFNDGLDEGGNYKIVKKLNHNASERDRRKKMNTLYSTLRSLLPAEDQSRKLSIPATVSRVLKHIPELQKEVQRLAQKKETLISKISRAQDSTNGNFNNMQTKKSNPNSLISANAIGNGEIVIQNSIKKSEKGSFCEAMQNLEEEGFLVTSASCFESFGGRVFYNLHLQAQGSQVTDAQTLKEKVWSCYSEKGQETTLT